MSSLPLFGDQDAMLAQGLAEARKQIVKLEASLFTVRHYNKILSEQIDLLEYDIRERAYDSDNPSTQTSLLGGSRLPMTGEIWQHTNGNKYIVGGISNGDKGRPDHPRDVIYASLDSSIVYTRRLWDWHRSLCYVGTKKE